MTNSNTPNTNGLPLSAEQIEQIARSENWNKGVQSMGDAITNMFADGMYNESEMLRAALQQSLATEIGSLLEMGGVTNVPRTVLNAIGTAIAPMVVPKQPMGNVDHRPLEVVVKDIEAALAKEMIEGTATPGVSTGSTLFARKIEIGKAYFVFTQSYFYIGLVTDIDDTGLILSKVVWVGHTGTLDATVDTGSLSTAIPMQCWGYLPHSSISIIFPWKHAIPNKPIENN